MTLLWTVLILLTGSLTPTLTEPAGFCDNFFPEVATAAELAVEVIHESTVTEGPPSQQVVEPRESNPHDVHVGCDAIAAGEGASTLHACYVPIPGAILTVSSTSVFRPIPPDVRAVIHCVRVLDRAEDGTGMYPTITGGGVGFDFVNMTLVSQFSEGLKYVTIIYIREEPIEQ